MDGFRENSIALLKWYQAMGVDEAVADAPCDWAGFGAAPSLELHADAEDPADVFASPRPARRSLPPQPVTRASPSAPLEGSALAAREIARQAPDLIALERALAQFDGCGLKRTAKHLCFARGSAKARLMLVGEAPGRDEDLEGRPFVGRAGKLLDRMLAAIGLGEEDVYITNVVYWRPPGNRTPMPQEVQACQPFIERQIELVSPEILVLLGGAAAKQILGTEEGIMKLRGKWRGYKTGEREIKAMATLHPAYLLRTPAAKRQAWRDLLTIKAALS